MTVPLHIEIRSLSGDWATQLEMISDDMYPIWVIVDALGVELFNTTAIMADPRVGIHAAAQLVWDKKALIAALKGG